jgi:hypothetical protein
VLKGHHQRSNWMLVVPAGDLMTLQVGLSTARDRIKEA